ncbi:TPA: hypothetical protein ACH3X1_012310 [Trebouxia sp. C0004]
MPAKQVRSGSNVADLITSAGLFGNALAKDQESQSSDQTAAAKNTRRHVTSRANSVDPPALIATGLLSRSASAKLQPPVSSWSATLTKQSSHDVPTSVRPTEESVQEASSLVAATSMLRNTTSSSGFQISAAKPSLLAHIQAVSQQAVSSLTARQQSCSHGQPHSEVNASGTDAAQASVSDELAGAAIAAKHVSSPAVAAANPQVQSEWGAPSVSPKLSTTRQRSSDSIFGGSDAEVQEAQADLPAGKAQQSGSAVARQGNRLTDEMLQFTIREAQATAANADISRRKAERRAQKLDKEVSHLQAQLTNHQRQTDILQQQVADASAASDQQKLSHQCTLALLDQAHLKQLSQLQKQLHKQLTYHSEAETKLKAQLVEQTDLTQQLRRAMTDLELDHHTLKRKSAEEQAVTKMLLKQQADSAAQTPSMQDSEPAAEGTATDIHKENARSDPQPAAQNPFLSVSAPASKTLVLEADVLRGEARVLREGLAKAEAAVQKLTQARREDELQRSTKLSQLERSLNELEKKHQGSAAVLDQTIAAMQTRTSILLQQRQSGQDDAAAALPGPTSNSPQLQVLSDMNEQLASENAALVGELAKLQRKQRQQREDEGRQRQGPSLVAGIPAHQLESLLSLPGTSPAAAVVVPCSSSSSSVPLDMLEAHTEAQDADKAQKKSVAQREMVPEAWDASHSVLQWRAQTLETQVELTRLRAEGVILRAEAAKALAEAQTAQGVINMLQRQLNAAHSQHDKEVKELRRATERRSEELTQQLPKTNDDSSQQVQAIRDDHAKQRHAWASARRTLQAQQSSLQDECNDLACQLAERDQQLRARDERISYLKKLLEEANLAVTSRRNSEAVALDVELGSGPLVSSGSKESSGPGHPERTPSNVEPNLDLPARLTLQRYRNEASAAKYEMTALMKELKRHKKESERVQLQQQLSIRGLKEQVNLAQQALQQQVIMQFNFLIAWSQNSRSHSINSLVLTRPDCLCNKWLCRSMRAYLCLRMCMAASVFLSVSVCLCA